MFYRLVHRLKYLKCVECGGLVPRRKVIYKNGMVYCSSSCCAKAVIRSVKMPYDIKWERG